MGFLGEQVVRRWLWHVPDFTAYMYQQLGNTYFLADMQYYHPEVQPSLSARGDIYAICGSTLFSTAG